ncbi:metal ABC transporter substrate-binding protein [Thermobifida cellulosilytica]|uniref:metal ABC transporter substrate-binding protein n=1 Tax=Thermobifida cellulosilytica TaxID=144786 RepID=UPI000A5C0C66|nr:metal ABC transporter substrate-binding protein [Thermobifida cellulosilytica]
MNSGITTKVITAGAAGALLASLTACSDGTGGASGTQVVTSVYPLEWLASRIGGEAVTVTNLAEAGTDPHELELSPRQIGAIGDADVVLHIGGMQPAIDEAVSQHAADRSLDAAEVVDLLPAPELELDEHEEDHGEHGEEEHGGLDPHLWLDPERMAVLAEALTDRLGEADPEHADVYRENRDAVTAELADLGSAYASGLSGCARRELVVAHAAFGYLADAHGLEQIGVTGLDSHTEPSPGRIAEVVHAVEEHGATTIFTSPLTDPSLARTVADEAGIEVSLLDPLESLTEESPGTDYPSVMRANLDALTAALDCS